MMNYCMKNGSLERTAAAAIIGAALGANTIVFSRELAMEKRDRSSDADEAAHGAVLGATIAIYASVWAAHAPKDAVFVRAIVAALFGAPIGLAMVEWVRKHCHFTWTKLATFACSAAAGRFIGNKCSRAIQNGANYAAVLAGGMAVTTFISITTCATADAVDDWIRRPAQQQPPADDDNDHEAPSFAFV